MYYSRTILPQLRKQIETPQIVVLTGMRRVGKTSLYRILFDEISSKNKVFLDIENPLEQKIFEETDYNNIWANLKSYGIDSKEKPYLFLDEIQAMPGIVKAVKYLHDHYKVKFFLTGSSSFYLKNLFPESLAGRKVIFELFPLSFEEFLLFRGIKKDVYTSFHDKDQKKNAITHEKVKKLYDEYVEFGGFPQVVLTDSQAQKKIQLVDIFKSYFEKEVQILADFRQLTTFRDVMLLLLSRVGAKLEIGKLASEVGVARETIYSYISFLEGTYFISLISPFSRSIDREVSGTKKLYLCDTGLINQFARVSGGSLFENAVFQNLRPYGEIHYYQRRSGGEVDFILGDQACFEVKTHGIIRDLQTVNMVASDLGIKQSYVISKDFIDKPGFIPATEV